MRALAAVFALAALPGCIIHGDGRPEYPPAGQDSRRAIFFEVLLDGLPCEEVPEVQLVLVTIGGEEIEVQCPASGERIMIPGFPPGTYEWKLEAIDANGYLLYEGAGEVDVLDESPVVAADLAPAELGMGVLTFFWSFGSQGLRCDEVGVLDVEVTIGEATFVMPCAPESAAEGASFDVPAGMYEWTLTARGADPRLLYAASGRFVISAGESLDVIAVLPGRVVTAEPGELLVTWTFAGSFNCARYEIENVYVQLWNGDVGLLGDDDLGVKLACSEHQVSIARVTPGSYRLDLHGESRQGGTLEITFAAEGIPVVVESGMVTEVEVDLKAL
jgi:hypothetical protein